MIAGIKPEQQPDEQEACFQALSELAPSLTQFFQSVADGCGVSSEASCVPTLTTEFFRLGNLTKRAARRIDSQCPPQFNIIFTAAYDPLLPMNMLVLLGMNIFEFKNSLRQMLQAVSVKPASYYEFGFYLGSALERILPLARLPPTKREWREITRGLVHAFTDAGQIDRGVPNTTMVAMGNRSCNDSVPTLPNCSGLIVKDECLDYVQQEMEEVYGPLMDITMGSLLNYTCYRQTLLLQDNMCFRRAALGLASMSNSFLTAYTLLPDLQKGICPERFVKVVERFNYKFNLTLDFWTNMLEHWFELEESAHECLELFLYNQSYDFGFKLGKMIDMATQPAFYRFQELKFHVSGRSWLEQVIYLIFLKSAIAGFAICPLLCLFCSACHGQPMNQQEVALTSECEEARLGFTYEFFGRQLELGSEIELQIETWEEDLPTQSLPSTPLRKRWNSSAISSSSPRRFLDSGKSRTKYLQSTALQIRECASYCILLTLTDELPQMSAGRRCLWTTVGLAVPCLAGGPRRWKLQTFSRRHGEWFEERIPVHFVGQLSRWLKRTLPQLDCANVKFVDSSSDGEEDSSSSSHEAKQSACELHPDGTLQLMPPSSPSAARRSLGMDSGPGSLVGVSQESSSTPDNIEAKFFLNHEHVRPPLLDKPVWTMLSASHMRGAILRLRPQVPHKECCDVLLLVSAWLQLALFGWHLLSLLLVYLPSAFQGEMLTLWHHWDRCAAALLVIHKKVQARWYSKVYSDRKIQVKAEKRQRCRPFCCPEFERTPTTVPLLTPAPSATTPRLPLPGKTLSRLCYRMRHNVGAGDSVRVKARGHPRFGQVGTLAHSAANEEQRLQVRFGCDSCWLLRSEISPVDGEGAQRHERHEPVWSDRLTEVIVCSTLVVWGVSCLLLLLFGEAMSDSSGMLVLRLQSDRDLWHWSFGFMIFVQCACIFIEGFVRATQWCVFTLAQAMIYR